MFDDNTQSQTVNDPATGAMAPAATTAPLPADPATSGFTPVDPITPVAEPMATPAPASDTPTDQVSFTPVTADEPAATPVSEPTVAPSEPLSQPSEQPSEATITPASDSNDLLSIKQDALQSLSPLLSHLDQTPEEKFRTTMMLIQASDDQSMVQAAYAAAKEITDEKVRAQALLDIVNEINYFTQQQAAATTPTV